MKKVRVWSEYDRLSFSAIEQYTSCGEQFRRLKSGEPPMPTAALIEGTSIHAAMSFNNKHKKRTGRETSTSKMVDVAAYTFEEEIETALVEFPSIEKVIVAKDFDFLVGRAKVWFEDYLTNYAADVHPEMIEEKVVKEVVVRGKAFQVQGVIDLATKTSVIDYKTLGEVATQKDADSSVQLSLYSMFAKKMQVELFCFVKGGGTPYIARVKSVRTPAHWQWALEVAVRVLAGIRKESFPFASSTNWKCDMRFCGFYDSCRGKYERIGAQRFKK